MVAVILGPVVVDIDFVIDVHGLVENEFIELSLVGVLVPHDVVVFLGLHLGPSFLVDFESLQFAGLSSHGLYDL